MKRYLITNSLKKSIRSNNHSMREISRTLGFEVKNIINKNFSVREDHLIKLSKFLHKKFKLKEVYINYEKNFGMKAFTKPIKKVNKNGNLAELIGIMLGDGNMWRTHVKIAFDKRNEKYIDYVEKLFDRVFGIGLRRSIIKETNQAYLYCYNRLVAQKLIDFGLKRGDKIKNKIGIPLWIKENIYYSKKCLKGLIDTDGCIYFSKRDKQRYIKFTNFNTHLLGDFKKLTILLGYHFAKANKNNWCLYRKEEVARFIKEINPLKSKGS